MEQKPIVGFDHYYYAQSPKLRELILDTFNLRSLSVQITNKHVSDLNNVRDLSEALTVPK